MKERYNKQMIQQQRVISPNFQGTYKHYTVSLNYNTQKESLSIQAQNSNTMERYSKVVDHNYLQGSILLKCFSVQPIHIYQYLVNNFDKVAFDDSGSFEFMFIWELRNELKEILVEISLAKHNISPVELANLKIERVRQQRKRDQIQYKLQLAQKTAKIKRLEDRLNRKLKKSKRQRDQERRKLDQQGQRIRQQLLEHINANKREQDEQNRINKIFLEEISQKMKRDFAEQLQRINYQQQFDKAQFKQENQKLINYVDGRFGQIFTQVDKIKQIVYTAISHHAGNTHHIYYNLVKTNPTSAKITRQGEYGCFNFVNSTQILPLKKKKYSIKINKTESSNILIGFCTNAGLGNRNNNTSPESAYYDCAGYFIQAGNYTEFNGLSAVEDVIDCEADLELGQLRWRRNGVFLRQFGLPEPMRGKGLYLSVIMLSISDEIDVSI